MASEAVAIRQLRAIVPLDRDQLLRYLRDDMEGAKEALEDFAREAVALYGRDAPKLLLHRAELATEHGDPASAKTWRELAAIAERIARRLTNGRKPSSAQSQPLPARRRSGKPSLMVGKKRGRR